MNPRKNPDRKGSSDKFVTSDAMQKLFRQIDCRPESKIQNLGNKVEAMEKRMSESLWKQEKKVDVRKFEANP